MAAVSAFYSVAQTEPLVYHNQSTCPDGKRIDASNKRDYTSYTTPKRRLCTECDEIAKE